MMLAKIHSRRTAYKLMVLSVLALEAFFGWRASLMYETVLRDEVGAVELQFVKWLVLVAITVFGFVLSTHRQFGLEAIYDRLAARKRGDPQAETTKAERLIGVAVAVVVIHDLAGTLYTIFQPGHPVTFGPIAMAVGACALVFIPFLVGHMALALAESGPREMREDVQQTILMYQHKLHLYALKRLYKHARKLEPEEILAGALPGFRRSRLLGRVARSITPLQPRRSLRGCCQWQGRKAGRRAATPFAARPSATEQAPARRRTRSEVEALVAEYQAGRYTPKSRQERHWLEQQARLLGQ